MNSDFDGKITEPAAAASPEPQPEPEAQPGTPAALSLVRRNCLIDQYWHFATEGSVYSPAFDEWIEAWRIEFGEYPSLDNPPVTRPAGLQYKPTLTLLPNNKQGID